MPGAFAHITLVNMLKETRRLDALGGFPDTAKAAVLKYFKYCELRIPVQTGHAFHGKLDSHSSRNWTLIPRQTGQ